MIRTDSDQLLLLLRETLHADSPDVSSLETVLESVSNGPDDLAVVWDYLLDTLRARLRAPNEAVWRRVGMSLSWCADHPLTFEARELLDGDGLRRGTQRSAP